MVFVPFYELCAEVFDEAESFATLYAMCGASDCEDDLTWESTTGNVTCAQYVSHPPPSLIKVSVLAARNGSGKTRQRQCLTRLGHRRGSGSTRKGNILALRKGAVF